MKTLFNFRFLVLCQYKMPGTFTVKAGFNLPGASDNSVSPVGADLEPVDIEYYEDFLTPVDNGLAGRVPSNVLSSYNSASQRHSRTLNAGNIFGNQEIGSGLLGGGGDKRMWMMVISVSSGDKISFTGL